MKIPLFWQIKIIVSIGIVAVSSAAIFVRLCQQEIEFVTIDFSLFIAASRLIISTIILIPTYKNFTKIENNNKGIYYSIGAGICLAFHFATWITSLSLTSVAASVSLVTTNPLWVALLSWWCWGKKIQQKTIIGISIAITGSVLIAFTSGNDNIGENPFWGAILALMGSWFASGYLLLGTSAQQKGLTITQYVGIAYLTAALCLFPLPLIFGGSYTGYPLSIYGYLILMAIIAQIIGHTSLNWSLKHLSPTTVSLIILLEPLISSILAWWLFREIPPPIVICGAFLLLIGVGISELSSKQ
ncbi:DMT family transporter [Geminocystis sp. NIES-3709]|uniref:DMT family transporter n=1 Tax=Geminocystis sp. NIES-3709 TaxID=1617448 RepID=UPI0005FC5539|nr:DMT family transporter [Geminocystis sp. NIES-3709]BAQ65378.1 permease of the drug/metabolite transporter (DMT) superfamily [Geminocystis sp. NIES-3709]